MLKFFNLKEEEENNSNVDEIQEHCDDVEIWMMDEEETMDMQEEVGSVVMDVVQTKTDLMIITPMAGAKLEDIDITLNKTVLTISGERKKPDFYADSWTEVKFQEVYFGPFLRNVILPENLDLDEIKAYMEDNMLVITIPRLQYDSKTIKINRIES